MITRTKIRFVSQDIDEFKTASSDLNPLHICDKYARKTLYWRDCCLWGLSTIIKTMQLLRTPKDLVLSRLTVDFLDAAFLDITYMAIVKSKIQRITLCR